MKNTAIYLLLIFLCTICAALSAQETLAPCQTKFMPEYFSGLDEVIDKAVKLPPELSITIIPSFIPEYAVRLANNKIYYVNLKSSFWTQGKFFEADQKKRTGSPVKIKTQVFSALLNPAIGNRVMRVYRSAISNAKSFNSIGLDGVTYHFSIPSVGCGKVWEPEPSSPDGQLVILLNLLISHSKLSIASDIQKSEESLIKTLDSIEHEI